MPIIVTYPVDLTGTNPNNLVLNEEVNLAALTTRLIVPAHGTFFELGLVVRDFYTQQPLVKHVDYVVAQLDPTATERSGGKACYQLLIFMNESINKVTLQYQCVGGPYSLSTEAIAEFIALLENDNRPITWGMLVGTPSAFPPAPHTTNVAETYGYADLIFALNRLGDKIAGGDAGAFEALYNYIDTAISGGSSNVATLSAAIEGKSNTKFMTPLRTKQVMTLALQNLTALAQTDVFEYDISADPAGWGYIRHKTNDLCICWGSGINLGPNEEYRVNFRRRFDVAPLLIPGDTTLSFDTIASASQWGEVNSRIPEHTVGVDGFHAVGARLSGTGTDKSKVRYIAIGKSSAGQPVATSSGYNSSIPPITAALEQPVWSGRSDGEVILASAETKYVGIAFPTDVQGGGVIISGLITTVQSPFYYTPYPANFATSEYEVMATAAIADAEYPGNFTYVGETLGTWIDLAVLKAKTVSDPTKGFMWTATDQYAGTMRVTVSIRRKANPAVIATRLFELKQTSNVLAIGPASPAANTTVTYYITNAATALLTLDFDSAGITIASQAGTDSFAFARTIVDLANYEVRTVMTTSAPNGYVVAGSSEDNNAWISAEAADPFIMTISNNTAILSDIAIMSFQLRHKKDKYKQIVFNVFLNKSGNGVLPAFNGVFNSLAWGSNAGCRLEIFLNSPNGSGYIQATTAAGADHGYFTYSFGKTGWLDSNYEAMVNVLEVHESGPNTFHVTYVGATLNQWNPMTSTYRWNVADTTSAGATAGYLRANITIRHKLTLQTASQEVQLGLAGGAYDPGGGTMD